jgi:putative peptidoglycan lipid II flippase
MLHRRGWFHFTASLASRIARQLIATAAMGAALWWMMPQLSSHYAGGVLERIWSLSVLVGLGLFVFFGVAFLVGALDKDLLAMLRRKRPARTKSDDEIPEVE